MRDNLVMEYILVICVEPEEFDDGMFGLFVSRDLDLFFPMLPPSSPVINAEFGSVKVVLGVPSVRDVLICPPI